MSKLFLLTNKNNTQYNLKLFICSQKSYLIDSFLNHFNLKILFLLHCSFFNKLLFCLLLLYSLIYKKNLYWTSK